ncbi:unnamed protein product, partial [Gulo gulo]
APVKKPCEQPWRHSLAGKPGSRRQVQLSAVRAASVKPRKRDPESDVMWLQHLRWNYGWGGDRRVLKNLAEDCLFPPRPFSYPRRGKK